MNSFPCYRRGACCRYVYLSNQTKFLDRGDGTCRHYAEDLKSCQIYDTRPDICRVDLQYIHQYQTQYDWNTFVAINIEACRYLESL